MSRFKALPLVAVFVLFIIGCGGRNSWMSRQWHNTNAHYNIYFNAEQLWNNTLLTLREGYKDDYRSFIEIYNYGSMDALKGSQAQMDEVIKKVSTMVDKHPKSRWVDDAYLLMGKAYFLKGDFYAAKDIFEYVNSTFSDPVIKYRSRLWLFKCLYFQNKISESENLLISLKNDKNFPSKLKPELNEALGAVYLRSNKPIRAAEHLALALDGTKGKMNRYRLHFALAQALQKNRNYDQAVTNYAKVVKMNPPYDMAFNARVNQVEILSLQKRDYSKANALLRKMLKDDKNIDYFGQIYYRMGINELRAKSDVKGIDFLNQSIQNSSKDKAQLTTTYLALGDYYYEKRNFERSGLYYDSANLYLDETHPDYESISKKSLQLSELLRHLITIKKEDSLLRLAADPVLRERTIDRLIQVEKDAKNKKPDAPGTSGPVGNPGTGSGGLNGLQNPGSSFPFYNPAVKSRGMQEFQSYWGQRTNRDFWRLNSKKTTTGSGGNGNTGPDGADTTGDSTDAVPDERKKYYADIPSTAEEIAEANQKIEEALMGAAAVYENSFGEPNSALFYYKELLRRYPNTKFEPQALYEIAKIYRNQENKPEFENYKSQLKTKYPESIYLKLLDDPNAVKNENPGEIKIAKQEIQELYEKMYNQYKAAQYQEALSTKKEADINFAGNVLQVKFDYLAGLCVIQSGNQAKGIDMLKQVVSDYPTTEEASSAQETIDAYYRRLNPVVETNDTTGKSSGGLWQKWDNKEELFFLLIYEKGANSNLIRAGLSDYNKENYIFEKLEVSSVMSSGSTIYLSVYNFSSPEICKEYTAMLGSKADFFASKGLFEYNIAWITKLNYQNLLKNNLINSYLDYYKTIK